MSCKNCKYFKPDGTSKVFPGECRRRAPQVTSHSGEFYKSSYSGEKETRSYNVTSWPRVEPDDDCGDFEVKEYV